MYYFKKAEIKKWLSATQSLDKNRTLVKWHKEECDKNKNQINQHHDQLKIT